VRGDVLRVPLQPLQPPDSTSRPAALTTLSKACWWRPRCHGTSDGASAAHARAMRPSRRRSAPPPPPVSTWVRRLCRARSAPSSRRAVRRWLGRPRRAGRPKLLTGRRSAVAQVLEDAASGVYTFNVDW